MMDLSSAVVLSFGSDAAGTNLSSPQLWLRSRHRWNKDGEVLRTGKTECCLFVLGLWEER